MELAYTISTSTIMDNVRYEYIQVCGGTILDFTIKHPIIFFTICIIVGYLFGLLFGYLWGKNKVIKLIK